MKNFLNWHQSCAYFAKPHSYFDLQANRKKFTPLPPLQNTKIISQCSTRIALKKRAALHIHVACGKTISDDTRRYANKCAKNISMLLPGECCGVGGKTLKRIGQCHTNSNWTQFRIIMISKSKKSTSIHKRRLCGCSCCHADAAPCSCQTFHLNLKIKKKR